MSKLSKLKTFLKSKIFIVLPAFIMGYLFIFYPLVLLPLATPFFFTIGFVLQNYYLLLIAFIIDILVFIFSSISMFTKNKFLLSFRFSVVILVTIFFPLLNLLPEILPVGQKFQCSTEMCIHPISWFLLIPINLSLLLPFVFVVDLFLKYRNLPLKDK